jgi:hypothetical protein
MNIDVIRTLVVDENLVLCRVLPDIAQYSWPPSAKPKCLKLPGTAKKSFCLAHFDLNQKIDLNKNLTVHRSTISRANCKEPLAADETPIKSLLHRLLLHERRHDARLASHLLAALDVMQEEIICPLGCFSAGSLNFLRSWLGDAVAL